MVYKHHLNTYIDKMSSVANGGFPQEEEWSEKLRLGEKDVLYTITYKTHWDLKIMWVTEWRRERIVGKVKRAKHDKKEIMSE